jgi:hypothetical protein
MNENKRRIGFACFMAATGAMIGCNIVPFGAEFLRANNMSLAILLAYILVPVGIFVSGLFISFRVVTVERRQMLLKWLFQPINATDVVRGGVWICMCVQLYHIFYFTVDSNSLLRADYGWSLFATQCVYNLVGIICMIISLQVVTTRQSKFMSISVVTSIGSSYGIAFVTPQIMSYLPFIFAFKLFGLASMVFGLSFFRPITLLNTSLEEDGNDDSTTFSSEDSSDEEVDVEAAITTSKTGNNAKGLSIVVVEDVTASTASSLSSSSSASANSTQPLCAVKVDE